MPLVERVEEMGSFRAKKKQPRQRPEIILIGVEKIDLGPRSRPLRPIFRNAPIERPDRMEVLTRS